MNEWNIQSRAHACQACGKSFSDGEPYHTLLFDTKHQIQRLDLCEPCWKSEPGEGAGDRQGFISHWQGVYAAPPPAPPDPIQKENAESLLRKIVASGDSRHAAVSYILAVMLERKRLLKVKEQFRRDTQRIFVYEQPRTGDLFTIPDPGLQLDQLAEVQRDVAALLEHGLSPPPEPPIPAAPASDEAAPATAPIPSTPPSEPAALPPAPAELESLPR